MPEGLDIAAQAEWTRVTGLLRGRGALDGLDQTAIGDYITCWARLRAAEAEITVHGLMVDGANGGRVKNPAATLARNYRAALLAWCREFGFTFSSRQRLAMPGASKKREPNRFESIRDGERVN